MRNTSKKTKINAPKVHCRNCVHYYITWDPQRPYGCRVMGFKTKRLPSLVVFESSGMDCQSFKPKPEPKKPK